ncbi:MAG: ABC transporter ATP-binding protein [Candidatus Saganbacteria bacterium]|nr:ABC transporter ATP-binding protein [Candidatus Saganbacteria bacterium]
MNSIAHWFFYLKQGLSRLKPADPISKDKKSLDLRTGLKFLRPFLLKHWPRAILGVIVVLVVSVFGYVQPLVTKFLIDNVMVGRQMQFFIPVILFLVAVNVLEKVGGAFQGFFFTRFGQGVVLDMQTDLVSRSLLFPKSFFDSKDTGYLMSRLSQDVQGLQWFFSSTLVFIFTNILRFFVGAVLLFYLEWRLSLVILVVLPLMVFGIKFFSERIRVLSHHNMEYRAGVMQRIQETLSSIPLIKSFASEKQESDRVKKDLEEVYHNSLEQNVVQSFAGIVIGSIGDVARLITMVAGIPLVVNGGWTMGSLYAFIAYLSYVYGPVQFLANTNFQLQNALVSLERVSSFYDVVPEEHSKEGTPQIKLSGRIDFKQVEFSYVPEEKVLKGISFSLKSGEHVAIVGTSGAGKTTLASLILGFYVPDKGEILFDGKNASSYSVDLLRRRIGYVSQNTRLLSGSIKENLCYGNPEAEIEEIVKAAKTAGIHDFIVNLPDKYDSLIGENGVSLSEGQRQRLSIARALIKKPDILIFDEPSSSLDSLTERAIFEILPGEVKGKTMIIITHKLYTVMHSSRILVIKDGNLVADGKHHSLMQENDFYRSLVESQEIIPEE